MKPFYSYDVKITSAADILRQGPLAETVVNCGELVITSVPYENYAECEEKLTTLLSTLQYIETKLGNKDHVLVSKVNPLEFGPEWDKFCIMKSYIVDPHSASFAYNIFGQIRSNREISSLI